MEEVARECYDVALRRLDVFTCNDVPALRLVLMDGRAIECFDDQTGFCWTNASLSHPDGSVTLL